MSLTGKRQLQHVAPGDLITAETANKLVDILNALIEQQHGGLNNDQMRMAELEATVPDAELFMLQHDIDPYGSSTAQGVEYEATSVSVSPVDGSASPGIEGIADILDSERLAGEIGMAIADLASDLHYITPAGVWHLATLTSDLHGDSAGATATARIYKIDGGTEVDAGFPELTVHPWALSGILESGCKVFVFVHRQSRRWYAMSWQCSLVSPPSISVSPSDLRGSISPDVCDHGDWCGGEYANSGNGTYECWEVAVAGVADDGCTDCDDYNGTHKIQLTTENLSQCTFTGQVSGGCIGLAAPGDWTLSMLLQRGAVLTTVCRNFLTLNWPDVGLTFSAEAGSFSAAAYWISQPNEPSFNCDPVDSNTFGFWCRTTTTTSQCQNWPLTLNVVPIACDYPLP